jgi:hypothetical protein
MTLGINGWYTSSAFGYSNTQKDKRQTKMLRQTHPMGENESL